MSQNPPPIPPQEAPESAPDKPVKKKRSLILCSWVIITGVALLALLLGWHPTCDNPLGTMSSPYSSDRWSGVPPTSGQHDAPPSEAEEHLDLGSQHLSDGRDREALECFRKATRRGSGQPRGLDEPGNLQQADGAQAGSSSRIREGAPTRPGRILGQSRPRTS